jgi:hypothetical protein
MVDFVHGCILDLTMLDITRHLLAPGTLVLDTPLHAIHDIKYTLVAHGALHGISQLEHLL